jgi:Histone methylation protein DOT1
MSAFTADEDKALLLLVVAFENSNGDIDWDRVIEHLSPTTKTVHEYQERLQYLKTEDTTLLDELSTTYISGTSLDKARVNKNRSVEEIYAIVEEIFGHLTRKDVRQPSGKSELNAGEIAPVGVTAIVKEVDFTTQDVFVDIGSGIGSILAQIVLQTPVMRCVGLEIRADIAQKSRDAFEAAKRKYTRLDKVNVVTGDVKAMSLNVEKELLDPTIVYSNNLTFSAEDNLALKDFICEHQTTRLVLLSQKFCTRCSPSCTDEFCTKWEEVKTIQAKTCWKDQPADIFLYKRKVASLVSFLASF